MQQQQQQQQQQQAAMNQARGAQPGQMQGANQVGHSSHPPPQSTSRPQEVEEIIARNNLDPNNMSQEQLQRMSVQPTNVQAKSVQVYSEAMQQQMQTALNRTAANTNKGMPQNPAMPGAQSSPMAQQNMNAGAQGGEFEYNPRMGMPPQNGPAPATGGQPQANNGNHALQDYQMQLMLLEQQNKKRLLMARQEQDSMAHPTGVPGPNGGQYAPNMSPQGSRTGAPSPNPGDMQRSTPNIRYMGMSPNTNVTGRGSPQPGMMDPNNPQMRAGMPIGPDGRPMRMGQPPSSHPMAGQMNQQQMEMMRQQGMMQNGGQMYQGGPQGPQGQMMPGQPPGQAGAPGQPPNMTPRPNNMPPPPAPTNAGQSGTQPSSPAQPAAPPTPNQANKAKPGAKKAADNKKVGQLRKADSALDTLTHSQGPASKKGADNQSENAPPTPTPPPPVTPSNAQAFGNNRNLPAQNGAPGQAPQNNGQQNNVQPQVSDINNQPFGDLSGPDQFNGMDFANLDSGDVLDNFDFDSFLNNTGADDGGLAFDANFAFGDGIGTETDGLN